MYHIGMTKDAITQEFSTTIKFPRTTILLEDLLLHLPQDAKDNVNTTLSISNDIVWLGESNEGVSHEVLTVVATWSK